jgi:hypothetical protein
MRSGLALCSVAVICALVLPAAASVGPTTTPVVSPPLGLLKKADEPAEVKFVVTNFEVPIKARPAGAPVPVDTAVQGVDVAHSPDVIGVNFEGVGVSNSAPPDTNGRVGKNHYVQWVNTQLAVWDKSGNLLAGPIKGNTLFKSLGGTCATHNDGDPIAQYDILADRWILTQFAVFATDGSFSHQCVAVSMSGDPLGSYYLYDFRTSTQADEFVDYPHVGIWPDGYYTTTHQFESDGGGGFFFGGQGLYVFDRASMLAGLPATYQFHNFGESFPLLFLFGGALPGDLDSLTPPPAGSPAFVVQFGSPDTDGSAGFVVHVWKVSTTWGGSPTLNVSAPTDVPVAPFNEQLCTAFIGGILLGARPCVPQPLPATTLDWLDGIPDRLMYRVAYRNFGDHESLVLNHTVNATGHQAGVRWYELRNPGSVPTLFQQGTYAGATPDAEHRWMASIAQDNSGNILLGYSKSSLTLLPEIDVAGRLASDPLGILGKEILMKAGAGVQLDTGNRWGDYSAMTVDPLDGCSFWYTNQYLPNNGSFNWRTRIGSFRYSSCVAPPQGTIQGTVTDCATGAPMSRAMVQTDNGFSAASDSNGHYAITLPPGNYNVSASAPDRRCAPSSSSPVSVTSGGSVTQNFCLTGSPKLQFGSSAIDDSAASNNGMVNKDECVKLSVSVANNGCGAATRVSGTLSTSTPGVTVNQPSASYGDIARDASAANSPAFSFSTSTANGFLCGAPIDFTLALSSDQAANSIHFSIPTCQGAPSVSRSGSITTGDAIQNARMGRDSSPSGCEAGKGCPGPLGSGDRHFDSYSFSNDAQVSACIKVNITADPSCSGGNQIFSAAYLDSYDPQNLCTNYIADEGQSPDLGFNNYSFDVPAGRNFVVVVDSVQPDGTFTGCPGYSLTVSGFIDTTTTGSGACPAPPVTTCLEDNDPQISYAKGWHLANSATASAGHFRFNASTNTGTAASLTFSVPAGSTGSLKYNYATSTKGGSADIYLDGAFRETISYVGSSGGMKDPVFGFNSKYGGLAAGQHTFELRNMKGVAYIDGFCLTSASSSSTPASGPGQTTTSSGTPGAGLGLLQDVAVPPGGTAISSVAESSIGVPIQLLILSPTGVVLASSTSTSGITVAEAPVSEAGMYVVKTINLSLGPVSVWTASTPQVNR